MDNNLNGKTYVVTGATSGIGLAVAEELARRGANIIGVGRSGERCRSAEAHLATIAGRECATYVVADLALQSQVHSAAVQIRDLLTARGQKHLDGLVNNAGTFTYWLSLTSEGFETQWAVNHLAAFRLTNELLPLLQAAPWARVVTVSSDSHYAGRMQWDDLQLRRNYNGLRAYEQSKLANVLFTLELNHRLGPRSTVRAFAADPGLVKTDIGLKGTPALVRWVWNLRRSGGTGPDVPARSIVYLATEAGLQNRPEIYWKDSTPRRVNPRGMDHEAAGRLWNLSQQMCSLA